ncbi:MAG: hypothetical protein JWN76_3512 [Chitinophagaceae bacterium]|nr:hypothetical protein [Chitinophagaceae bacterium]
MVINTWKEYWEVYEKLCDSLNTRNRKDLTLKLDEIKLYINGSRRGYTDFLKALQQLVNKNRDRLTKPENQFAQALIAELHDALKR